MPHSKIIKWMIAASALTGAAIIYFLYDPLKYNFYLVCPLHYVTGLKCPVCGLQQMIHHLLHGQISAAFFDNPLAFILIPYFLLLIYFRGFRKNEKYPRLFEILYGNRTVLILLVVALIFAVCRNFV